MLARFILHPYPHAVQSRQVRGRLAVILGGDFGVASRLLQREPAPQMGVERGLVAGGNPADDFAHEAGFDGGELGLDGAGDVQAGGLPVGEREVRIAKLRGEGDDEEVAGKCAEADDDGGADLVAAQIRERNGQEHHVIA